ncbi:hypothetical protein GCM10022240_27470 [Microbacterium kribbense]|uniref:Uncharacterized protein n=1 Tax=Microbacterium kribbense TaxID=433645 RepID=A0ABP7GYJ1_9MICO
MYQGGGMPLWHSGTFAARDAGSWGSRHRSGADCEAMMAELGPLSPDPTGRASARAGAFPVITGAQ